MSELVPFEPLLFGQFAEERELNYLVDAKRQRYLIPLNFADLPRLDCWLSSEADGAIVSVRVFAPGERFAPEAEGAFQATCGAWNRIKRWPKAYVELISHGAAYCHIVLEGFLPVAAGVPPELLASFIDLHIEGAARFWQELGLERQLQAS